MVKIKGNFWIDLIEKEAEIKKEIERVVDKMIGRRFKNYSEMSEKVKEAISRRLEEYGLKHHMGIFNAEYDISITQDKNHTFVGYEIKFVFIDEDIF